MVEPGNLAGATGAEWIGRPPHEELQRKVRPLLPSDDPFYFPPAGYQHAVPGTVLRSRDVELAFMGLIPQPVTATQLLYRTTNMYGNPEATVTTVIVPAELAPGQTCPLLSYQCAIDAMSSRCFPSYAPATTGQGPGVTDPNGAVDDQRRTCRRMGGISTRP